MKTILTKNQTQTMSKEYYQNGEYKIIEAIVRYDDRCGNGHNTFSITGGIFSSNGPHYESVRVSSDGKLRWLVSCGCIHGEIEKHFPALKPFLKWHLMSSDEPLHYVANSLYWAGHYKDCCDGKKDSPPNWDCFEKTCLYGTVSGDTRVPISAIKAMNRKRLEKWLTDRLPLLQIEFRKSVESLGFVF